jgi:serine/threonine-protein kinase
VLLIAAAVGTAVVVTSRYGANVAEKAVRSSLDGSHLSQSLAQQQRYEQLRMVGQIFQSDPNLQSYIAEAAQSSDTQSLLDLFEERGRSLDYDFAIAVDGSGRVLARTDKPGGVGQDLSGNALLRQANEDGEAAGVWAEGEALYYAVAVPVVRAGTRQGFVVTAFRVNGDLASEMRRATGADVVYLAQTAAGPRVVASTLDAAGSAELLAAIRRQGDLLRSALASGKAIESVPLTMAGRPMVALLAPLKDAAGQSVGARVSVASTEAASAGYRDIQKVLTGVGLIAVLAAGGLSYWLSRSALGSVRKLVRVAESARQGNYDQKIDVGRGDEVGKLAQTLAVLLANLREKRDMEAYVSDLSRNMPDAGGGGALFIATQARRLALLGLDLRTYAGRRRAEDPRTTIEGMSRDLRRVVAAVTSRRGHVEAVQGHRILASFEGDDRSFAALSAAAEIGRALSVRESAFEDPEPPAMAISVGEAATGSLVWGDASGRAVAGPPVQSLEGLLREGAPGDVLVAREANEELRSVFASAGFEPAAQRAILGGFSYYPVSLEMAIRVTGLPAAEAEPAEAAQATLSEVAPGSLLGRRFEILSVLGAGGMGVVYKARDRELDDLVALKMLKRQVADDADLLARLRSEIKLARKITHPNVLRTFDIGEIDGVHFISMEYVRGITLRSLLDHEGRLPYAAGLRIAKNLCAGLGAAHAAGVLHRDIKPENLILDHAGSARLMDFGIARPTQRVEPGQTQQGWIVGTPQYLSPEQIEGKDLDERSDIYATGVVLYEIFAGIAPFRDENPMQILFKHLHEPAPPAHNFWPEIPAALESLIARCLEKDRAARFPGVPDLLRALEALSH